jgi:nucleolar MIF4G domain-containing protein 1
MKIRSDDPFAMKNFIQSVQNRVNELNASGDGQEKINGKRVSL